MPIEATYVLKPSKREICKFSHGLWGVTLVFPKKSDLPQFLQDLEAELQDFITTLPPDMEGPKIHNILVDVCRTVNKLEDV